MTNFKNLIATGLALGTLFGPIAAANAAVIKDQAFGNPVMAYSNLNQPNSNHLLASRDQHVLLARAENNQAGQGWTKDPETWAAQYGV